MSDSNSSLKTRLLVWFLVCGIAPLTIVGFITYLIAAGSVDKVETQGEAALSDAAYAQLASMRNSKRLQVQNHFAERKADLKVLAETETVLNLILSNTSD